MLNIVDNAARKFNFQKIVVEIILPHIYHRIDFMATQKIGWMKHASSVQVYEIRYKGILLIADCFHDHIYIYIYIYIYTYTYICLYVACFSFLTYILQSSTLIKMITSLAINLVTQSFYIRIKSEAFLKLRSLKEMFLKLKYGQGRIYFQSLRCRF